MFKVDGNRMRDVAFYCLSKSLRHFLEGRAGMLLKNTPVNEETAQALVDSGYKYMSQFGYSCPVQVRTYVLDFAPFSRTSVQHTYVA